MILVTGATGTVGSQVIEQLAGRGVPVRAGCHHPDRAGWIRDLGIEVVPFDFTREATIDAAMREVDHLFLLTPPGVNQAEEAKRAIDVAKSRGVQHVVRLSVIGANAKRSIQMGRWHGEIEEYLMASGLPWTILRPNTFMDNFAEYYGESIRRDNAIYLPMREAKVSYIAADDIAAVSVEALVNPGHVGKKYVLTGPQALGVADVADILRASTGRPVRYVDIDDNTTRKAMMDMGMPRELADAMMEVFEVQREGHAALVTDTVREVTGRPAMSFEAWSCRHVDKFATPWAA